MRHGDSENGRPAGLGCIQHSVTKVFSPLPTPQLPGPSLLQGNKGTYPARAGRGLAGQREVGGGAEATPTDRAT